MATQAAEMKQDAPRNKRRREQAQQRHDEYGYYEQLRESAFSFDPLVPDPAHVGRNLYQMQPTEQDEPLILCHIPTFFRWSQETANGLVDVSNEAYGGSAAALLAMHHFNTGDSSVVDDLDGINTTCPIRLTTELVDTVSSGIVATRRLLTHLTRSPSSRTHPQPCAVLGSSWSSVTRKLATLTGVYDLPQVTSSASSVTLDDAAEYPLFARTHPSDLSMAQLSVDFLALVLQVRYFAVVYIDNVFGDSYHTAVINQAALNNMTVVSVSFRPDATRQELQQALQQLKGYHYFLGVFFAGQYQDVMETAAELGLAGPGRFWMFNGALASSFVNGQTDLETVSAQRATFGSAILHDEGGLPGIPFYDRFLEEWSKIGRNGFLDYINTHVPNATFARTGEYFQQAPSHIAAFSYDAVVGLGLSACRALENKTEIFSGQEHHAAFVDNAFVGATGDVTIGPGSFSRRGTSTFHVVSNILPVNQGRTTNATAFRAIPTMLFDTDNQRWIPYGNHSFVFSDGSLVPPAEIPALRQETNNAGSATRIVCLCLSALGMSLAIGFLVFTFWMRGHRVIKASQPPFLFMTCFGALLMASSIIPAAVDDSVASKRGCDIACIAKYWLFSIGFCISFSALFSKLWRINKLYRNATGFRRVQVEARDVIVPFLILLGLNVAFLVVLTVAFPPRWTREVLEYDSYGRPQETLGKCVFDDQGVGFAVAILVVNGCALVLALWQAYVARNITTDFSESKYIGMATVCIFQALFIGVPIVFIVDDQPSASLFIYAGVISIICWSILLLIFVPKILAIRRNEPLRNIVRRSIPSSVPKGISAASLQYRPSGLGDITTFSEVELPTTRLKPIPSENDDDDEKKANGSEPADPVKQSGATGVQQMKETSAAAVAKKYPAL